MKVEINCIVLYCIVLYCIVLYCIVLYCTILEKYAHRIQGSFQKEYVNVHTMHLKWRKSDVAKLKYWPETKLCS